MSKSATGKSEPQFRPLLAAALLLTVAACAQKKSVDPQVDPFAPSAHRREARRMNPPMNADLLHLL